MAALAYISKSPYYPRKYRGQWVYCLNYSEVRPGFYRVRAKGVYVLLFSKQIIQL